MTLVASLLPSVIDAVGEAAAMLVEESRRPAGPRGAGSKAQIDVEIEHYLADRLTAFCRHGSSARRRPRDPATARPYCWLVDPHDGTWAYLQGYRGSAVSVALLRDGVPVLGVVCAPMSPDRGRDLIAWAEGLPHLLRNGVEVAVDLSRARLERRRDRLPGSRQGGEAGRIGHCRRTGALRQHAEHRLPAGAGRGGGRRGDSLPERARRARLRRRPCLVAGRRRRAAQ